MYKLIHGHLGLNSDKFLNVVKGCLLPATSTYDCSVHEYISIVKLIFAQNAALQNIFLGLQAAGIRTDY
jgi:hypothetical protein